MSTTDNEPEWLHDLISLAYRGAEGGFGSNAGVDAALARIVALRAAAKNLLAAAQRASVAAVPHDQSLQGAAYAMEDALKLCDP